MDRLIGAHGSEGHSVLILAFGALHGNEPAGVAAIQTVLELLEQESAQNPGFHFQGTFVGIIGNMQAYARGIRFMERDLNRMWLSTEIERIRSTTATHALVGEDAEMAELVALLDQLLMQHQPETLILLDLHTTSAGGGIFCIPTDKMASLRLAKALHAPVILNLFDGIQGSLLRYANEAHFLNTPHSPRHNLGVAFEAGQHDDPESVSRAAGVIVSTFRAAGCIRPKDLQNRHEHILVTNNAHLPKVTFLRHIHHIEPNDHFRMRPGYLNFQAIKKGEHLADDAAGPVLAPQDGLILMPLYQPVGSDGFFVVEEELRN